jgi:iron complex outermembrane recepter protein
VTKPPFPCLRFLQLAGIFALAGIPAVRPADADTSGGTSATTSAGASPAAATNANTGTSAANPPGEEVVRLTEVEVYAGKVSAVTQAPVASNLETLQPQSIISAQTINNTIAPTADYATIANIAPSIVNVETEGPGLSESKNLSMRGFQDGQYNVTYDGIPFGDANGETHHTTSYFPAKVLGGEDIERGPGTAADIGENTFGGTIGLLSKDPRPDEATVLTFSDGSWNTFLGNVEYNTGDLPKFNDASLVATYQYMSSDGYRTFSYLQRNTYYLKYVQPIGKNTTLTVVGNYNNIKFNNPGTVTQAQINQFGRNYGLDANPFDPNENYYPYNYQQKQADFEYIGLKSRFGGDFSLDDKAYTYYYNNDSHENSTDPVVGGTTKFPGTTTAYTGPAYVNNSPNTLPNTGESEPASSGIASNDDPGGRIKVNAYRALGDYLALSHGDDTSLEENIGVWVEYVKADRYSYDLDYSPAYLAANPQDAYTFGAFDPASGYKNNTLKPGYEWLMHVYNKTFQPYADFVWKPIKNLTIEAGVKDSNFTIDLEAPINQGTEQPDFNNYTYTNVEPHFSANYSFTPNWSAYVQLAKGIAYPIVTDEENVPEDAKDTNGLTYNPSTLKEETTINYQAGTVFKTDKFNADADAYLIDIDNLVSSVTDPNDSTNTLFFESKGAWVSGVEAEATYYLGGGVSVYANGSLNRATYKTDAGIPSFNVASLGGGAELEGGGVPNSTASFGAIINRSGWFASIADKYVGPYVVYSSALTNPDLGLYGQTSTGQAGGTLVPVLFATNPGYWMMDLAIGYAFKMPPGSPVRSFKIKLQVDNALDHKVQDLSAVASSGNSFNVLPTTNYFVTLSTEF